MKCTFKDYLGVDGPQVECSDEVVAEVQAPAGAWRACCASHLFLAPGQGFSTMRGVKRYVDLNVKVRVALTRDGAAMLHATHPFDQAAYTTELWDLMVAFGAHMHMGMRCTPFVNNLIEVVRG